MTEPKPRKPRTTVTPAQKAQENYDVEARKIKSLTDKIDTLNRALDKLDEELPKAQARLEYAAANPDMPARKVQVNPASA